MHKKARAILFLSWALLMTSSPSLAAESDTGVAADKVPQSNNPVTGDILTPQDLKAKATLDSLSNEAVKDSGTIFVNPEQVIVHPPLLSGLITLNKTLPSYQLDAGSSLEITLSDVLDSVLLQNLDIKIAGCDVLNKRWQYIGALSQFLPSLNNSVGYQGIHGNYVSPAGLIIPIANPFYSSGFSFTETLFKGGSIIFGATETHHEYKAAQLLLQGTSNDMMLEAASQYYKLALNDALLQIRMKLVDTAQALVVVQKDLYENGVNTELDVLQAKYELSEARQALIAQQIERRQAAVTLATVLNLNPDNDLVLHDRTVSKLRLVDDTLPMNDLIRIAIDSRPELKHYEQLRLAAKDKVRVARAALFPTVSTTGTIIGTGSRATNVSSSAGSTSMSSSGLAVGAVGAASDLALSGSGSGTTKWTTSSLGVIGLDVTWTLGGLGIAQESQVESARAEARRATLDFDRNLARIYEEVRDSFLTSLKNENLINETTDAVNFTEEGLRVAVVRLKDGVGTYLDVINAQRNYTKALIDKANAIIAYDTAQVSMLHALGRMNVATIAGKAPVKE
jgi:outer membrane protein TolC